MEVLTKIDNAMVDALDLDALFQALAPTVKKKIDEMFEASENQLAECKQSLQHATTLAFAVRFQLGAFAYQREQMGMMDSALLQLIDELSIALGLSMDEEEPCIVVPE